jgi:hypothetical protein
MRRIGHPVAPAGVRGGAVPGGWVSDVVVLLITIPVITAFIGYITTSLR